MADSLNEAQRSALGVLSAALGMATESGLLDELAGSVHPDWINGVCDAVGGIKKLHSENEQADLERQESVCVSLDGGRNYFKVLQGLRVSCGPLDAPDGGQAGHIEMTISDEGVVSDFWGQGLAGAQDSKGTRSQTWLEMAEEMVFAGP